MSDAKRTSDIHKIRNWAEERGGKPAIIKGTSGSNGNGLLRIHFPDVSENNEDFEIISWDRFGKGMEENNLALLYQEEKDNGETSTFHKLIDRDEDTGN